MSAAEWDATPWPEQRAYLDGLDEDESVPISFEGGGAEERPEIANLHPSEQPQTRQDVDAGMHVIDLTAMRTSLEGQREGGG
jgi:hypothetical protein